MFSKYFMLSDAIPPPPLSFSRRSLSYFYFRSVAFFFPFHASVIISGVWVHDSSDSARGAELPVKDGDSFLAHAWCLLLQIFVQHFLIAKVVLTASLSLATWRIQRNWDTFLANKVRHLYFFQLLIFQHVQNKYCNNKSIWIHHKCLT